MKFVYAAIVAILLLGCQNSGSVGMPKGRKALPSKSDKIIEDRFGQYRIYQRSDKSFYLYREGRIVYDRLKFISHASLPSKNNMQALDKDNKLLEFAVYDEQIQLPLCGVGVMEYQIDILESGGGFDVGILLTDGSDTENYPEIKPLLNKRQNISFVSKSKVDDIYFAKHKKRVEFEGYLDSNMLYYQRGKQYGFYGKLKRLKRRNATVSLKYSILRQSSGLYDAMEFQGKDILLKRGKLWGCHGKTAIKYAALSPYRGVLARFTLPDGRSGYVTDKGVEYYD